MSSEATTLATNADDKEDKKLNEIFVQAWHTYEELEQTSLPFNSTEFQDKVKTAMSHLEDATRIVSQTDMFSPNEMIDEVSTESLQYLLLPFFLGKLALKLSGKDRLNVLEVAEIYFKDYIQRCEEYELCDGPKNKTDQQLSAVSSDNSKANELAQLIRAANSRNNKISQFRRKKELEEQIKLMREAVRNETIDDEAKREFFLNFLKKSIIDANEELDSLKLEKQIVEMRKVNMSADTSQDDNSAKHSQSLTTQRPATGHNYAHGHGHSHSHHGHFHGEQQRPKPLQPFIITRNAAQKAVFGMGYPSLPVMTVGEFYHQRVQEGIFPDEEKVAKMNQAQAIAATEDPNEKEDAEKAEVELQEEDDDPEYLARIRRMDDYKDVVRRGDGNRHNRS